MMQDLLLLLLLLLLLSLSLSLSLSLCVCVFVCACASICVHVGGPSREGGGSVWSYFDPTILPCRADMAFPAFSRVSYSTNAYPLQKREGENSIRHLDGWSLR
jgi:hypothetical protein